MRSFALFSCATVFFGCARAGEQPADSTAAAVMETPAISLSDVAGNWNMRSWSVTGGDTVTFVLSATADTAGWTRTDPNRKPEGVRVIAVDGDSIVTESGPYESVLRKGIQVTSRTVYRLRDGQLVGEVETHYALSTGDSVAQRRSQGTRAP